MAVTTAWWLGPAALPIGATLVVWAFDNQPTVRGEARWGLSIIIFGLASTVMVLGGTIRLVTGS